VLPSLEEQIGLIKGCKRIRASDSQGVKTGKIRLLLFSLWSVHTGWFTSMKKKSYSHKEKEDKE